MVNIAIIPARGGSKRLKNKNKSMVNGKPLIYYTMDVVSKLFDTVLVASDDDEILEIASQNPLCKPICIELPAEVTGDTNTVLQSVCWLMDNGKLNSCDQVGLFLPTCPLRSVEDVKNALNLMNKSFDGVISTTDYEFPPTLGLVTDKQGYLHCSDHSLPWLTGNTRSQDHNSIIRPNGAIYLKWHTSLVNDRNFYQGKIKSYHMPRSRSLDIDTIEDLKAFEGRLKWNLHVEEKHQI